MNILHLSGANIWGGNEEQLKDLIVNTSKFNIKNTIFCFKNTPLEEFSKNSHTPFFSTFSKKPHSFKLAKELTSYIKKNNFDIIHIHTTDFVLTFMIAGILFNLKVPTVFSKKGISDKSSFLSPLKYNYKKINSIICVSDAVKSSLLDVLYKKNYSKIITIYDGIDLKNTTYEVIDKKKYNIPDDKILIGSISNHTDAKDIPTLIKTANYLINKLEKKDLYFIQIGKKTKLTKEFEELISNYKLTNYFSFLGQIPNASKYLKNINAFILTSKKEGLGLVNLEAFKAKTPVITTNAGGIPEIIKNNETGLLCDVGDYESLAKGLNNMINDTNLTNKFTENAFQLLFEKFNAIDCAKNTIKIYKQISSK